MKQVLLFIVGLLFFGLATAQVSTPVNINTATVQQLISLKGIGSKKAKAIIVRRKQVGSFHSLNELTQIKGFGKAFLQRLLKWNQGRISFKN